MICLSRGILGFGIFSSNLFVSYSKPSRCPPEKNSKILARTLFLMKLLQTIYQKKVEFDKIMFCVELYFPKAAEAVRSRQLQNDQLTFLQISRVCIDLMFFR